MMKKYKIADLIVDMNVSGRTLLQAKPYEIHEDLPADMTIDLDAAKILEYAPHLETEDMAEYMATGTVFARRALQFDGYYIHSSAVVLDGKAYLFTAPSGTGKSTHTEKWIRLFGAHYLNDDKPILRRVNGKWMAYGTPWSGKNDLSSNEGVPVGGVACLKRADANAIVAMESAAALPYLMSQTLYHLRETALEKKLQLLDLLIKEIPIWELSCLPDDSAAYLSHKAMTGVE